MPDKKDRAHPEKLSERLEIRLPHSVKQRFLAACKRAGETPSDVLRTAMNGYIAEVETIEHQTFIQELTMKLVQSPLKALAMTGTSIAAAIMFTAAPSVADTDAQPLAHPHVVYPSDMVDQNRTADCVAKFDVDVNGKPESITVTCSDNGFVGAVHDAARTLRFEPKRADGRKIRRIGVEYPIEFKLAD